jgi:hypothetical protein
LAVPDFAVYTRQYQRGEWPLKHTIEAGLMGGQDYEFNFHYSLWDYNSLQQALIKAGYVGVRRYDPRQFLPAGFRDWSNMGVRGCQISLNVTAKSP